MISKNSSFEDNVDTICKVINQKKCKWSINCVNWLSWEDVVQILLIHIWKKWGHYNQEKQLEPWVAKIVTNQMFNLGRNVYYSNARPCLKCPENQGGDLCALFGKQCDDCPIHKKWTNTKKRAHDIRLPLTMENHQSEVFDIPDKNLDIEKYIVLVHEQMKNLLTKRQYKVYEMLYIDGKTEKETNEKMGYKLLKNKYGYSRLKQINNIILSKIEEVKNKIDIY